MSVSFVKATAKGLVVSDKAINVKTVVINGKERSFRSQGGILGFIACENPGELKLTVGQSLPFRITDVNVKDKATGNPVPNVYWAEPE